MQHCQWQGERVSATMVLGSSLAATFKFERGFVVRQKWTGCAHWLPFNIVLTLGVVITLKFTNLQGNCLKG